MIGTNPVILNQSYGTFIVNAETASLVTSPLEFLATSNDIATHTDGQLTITSSANNLSEPDGLSNFRSQFTGTFLNHVTQINDKTYYNPSNTLFAAEHLLSDLNGGPASPFSLEDFADVSTDIPFSVTEVVTFKFGGAGMIGTTAQINAAAVPEPSTLMLFGGFLGLAGLWWRGGKKSLDGSDNSA